MTAIRNKKVLNRESFLGVGELTPPFEYLQGFISFLGCKINLSKRPFIPRIETEFWVKKAIEEIVQNQQIGSPTRKKFNILDIFAGSGCIGTAILKNYPEICRRVDFIDINEKFLTQVRINLRKNQINNRKFRVLKSNIFRKLLTKKSKGSKIVLYDYIFANPPYVDTYRVKEVSRHALRHEPEIALFGGKDGLFYIEQFLGKAKIFLKDHGIIYLEFDPQQKNKIKHILRKHHYPKFKFRRDQFKDYRWVKIFKRSK